MAGQRSSKNNQSAKAEARRGRRGIGLGGSGGAFLAFGLYPLAGAPTAKADVFDDILDTVVGSAASSAVTAGNPTDFLDPGAFSGLLTDLGTPAGGGTLFNDLGNATSFSSLFSGQTSLASDAGSAAATPDSRTASRRGLG